MSTTSPRPSPPFCKWRRGGQGVLGGGWDSRVGWPGDCQRKARPDCCTREGGLTSAVRLRAFPLTPALSLGERGNRPPTHVTAPPFCKWRRGGQGGLDGGWGSGVGWHNYCGPIGRRTSGRGYPARWAGLRNDGPLGLGGSFGRTGPGQWALVQSRSKTGAPLEWRANEAGRALVRGCNWATCRLVQKRGHARALQKVAGGRLFHNRAGNGQV